MANQSIYAAFERMWQHILSKLQEYKPEGFATEEYVNTQVANLVNSAPEALNTLGELAAALENHEDAYDALLETVGSKATYTDLENLNNTKLNKTETAVAANKLATARTINLTGDVSGSGSFDGSGDLTITATVADNSHNHNNYMTDSQSISEDSDFNTVTKSGVYRYNNITSYTNAPPTSWGQMLVLHGAGDTISQLAFDYSGANAWIRGGNGPEVGGAGSWYDWKRIWCEGNSVTGAVWNDYAECRESDCDEPGYVLSENGDDTLSKSIERLAPFAGVSSDTWGFSQGETEKAKTHIAVAGRVLVYPYQDRNNYKPGDCVCAAPGGTVDIMTREEVREWPDRIVGTVSCVPEYEEWGGGEGADRDPVQVNGRIWIKVK